MTDDKFFERLRDDARRLRYEPNDVMLSRLSARVRERITAAPTVAHFLARWFRPVAASMAVLAVTAILGVQYFESNQQPATLEAAMSADPVEISVDGDIYTLTQ
ncbi:MAG: hypothetical protein AABO58_17380 [Acidobacteriota bacterium]